MHGHHRPAAEPRPAPPWATPAPAATRGQIPHRPEAYDHGHEHPEPEPDLDLVEQAVIDAFPTCPDPTSFLRPAGKRRAPLQIETMDTPKWRA